MKKLVLTGLVGFALLGLVGCGQKVIEPKPTCVDSKCVDKAVSDVVDDVIN